MIKEIIYVYASIGSIISFLYIIGSAIFFLIKRKDIKFDALLIFSSTAIISLVMLLLIFIWPEHLLPKSKQYIAWKPPKYATNQGAFQDFDDLNEDLVDKLWADPAAELHGGLRPAEISCKIVSDDLRNKNYFLKINFKSHGYGSNITIRCKGSIPTNASQARKLIFQAKFIPKFQRDKSLNLKIRIFDKDDEVWFSLCRGIENYPLNPPPDVIIPASHIFKDYEFDLTCLKESGMKFKHDGNVLGGDLKPSLEAVSRITFDMLPRGIEGELHLDNLRFE